MWQLQQSSATFKMDGGATESYTQGAAEEEPDMTDTDKVCYRKLTKYKYQLVQDHKVIPVAGYSRPHTFFPASEWTYTPTSRFSFMNMWWHPTTKRTAITYESAFPMLPPTNPIPVSPRLYSRMACRSMVESVLVVNRPAWHNAP